MPRGAGHERLSKRKMPSQPQMPGSLRGWKCSPMVAASRRLPRWTQPTRPLRRLQPLWHLTDPALTGIDKSVLTVAEPRRYRSREHLRLVAKQPCLVCGRKHSDPHHLRFAQPNSAVKSATNLSCPFAVSIIGQFIGSLMSRGGGSRLASNRLRSRAGCGSARASVALRPSLKTDPSESDSEARPDRAIV
jgi:hypothetical protein